MYLKKPNRIEVSANYLEKVKRKGKWVRGIELEELMDLRN